MPGPAVEIVDLVKRYGGTTALDGLSLRVAQGGVTAVLGPNGAGKTSALECCEGFRQPDSGTVRVLGRVPGPNTRDLHSRVGVMLQSGGIYPGIRAAEMLRHVAALHAHPLDVAALTERLGLGAAGRTPYRRLSGGLQRRLSLALAVVGRPELVFLDEPSAGLDPQARHACWELVEDLRADGVTIVLTTHLMEEAQRLADQVAIIDAGRLIAQGSPTELTSGSGADAVRFSAPPGLDLDELSSALPPDLVAREQVPGSYVVEGPLDPGALAAVTAWCAGNGVMPEGLVVGRRTLEDVFIELTGRGLRS